MTPLLTLLSTNSSTGVGLQEAIRISEPTPVAQINPESTSTTRLKELISGLEQGGGSSPPSDKSVLLTVMKYARNFDSEFNFHQSRHFFAFLTDPNLASYVLHLYVDVVPDIHVPFDSVIDHHFSWDEKGGWIVYFKNLYKHLPSRKAKLLHAAIKIINISNGYVGSEERHRQMVTINRSEIWINVDKALETVIATAKSHDEDYQSKQPEELCVDAELASFELYLFESVVPELHIPFDLVIDHHLAWDATGHWNNFFKTLFHRLPDFEAQLLHAALKIITLSETFPGSQKRRLEIARPDLERSKVRVMQLSPLTPMMKSPRVHVSSISGLPTLLSHELASPHTCPVS
jgi:hypothetical protein